jgi:protoporphyrinogen oxidase
MSVSQSKSNTVVIIGGGLSGLSALWHLQQQGFDQAVLFEKEARVGGLARSEVVDGFTFDYTGHLLHFRHEAIQALVRRVLGENLRQHARNSWIFSKGVYTRYPFQSNLYGLPVEVIKECILEFSRNACGRAIDALSTTVPEVIEYSNFGEWVQAAMGAGIARHFMIPYNEKLWTVPCHELTCEWMGRFVPRTTLKQLLDGAFEDRPDQQGYNASFVYPVSGGIEALPRAFADSLQNIHCGVELQALDLERKIARFSNGTELSYETLISSIPIPELIRRTEPVSAQIRSATAKLRWASVYNLNFGIQGNVSDKHWIYVPEPEWLFYRIGFPHNFSARQAPSGCSSIYVEIAYSGSKPLEKNGLAEIVKQQLAQMGVLEPNSRIVAQLHQDIPYAYVICDHQYHTNIELIRSYLKRHRVQTVGRYGAWEYASMEDAIAQGADAARQILEGRD